MKYGSIITIKKPVNQIYLEWSCVLVRPFKRFNTIFYKLIFSYTLLTIVITVILGMTSYYYSSKAINSQIDKINEKMLEHLKNTMEISVFKRIDDAFLNITIGKHVNNDLIYLFENPSSMDYSKLNNAYLFLKDLASANSAVIDSIYIYFPYKNTLLASSFGIKFLDDETRKNYKDTDWFKAILEYQGKSQWIETRKVPNNMEINSGSSDMLSYIRSYPYLSNSADYKGFVVINFKEKVLSQCIRDIAPDENKNIFILAPDGLIISAGSQDLLYNNINDKPYVQSMLESDKTYESSTQRVDGIASIVTFTSLPSTDWKLVNITSVGQFFKQSAFIRQVLIIICISVLFIGFIIANIFTSYIYNPLKALINGIRSIFKDSRPFPVYKHPEFGYINEIVNNLSVKVNELESTLEANRPLIKHNLISGLLNKRFSIRAEFEEQLNLVADLQITQSYFLSAAIELDDKLISALSMENSTFMKYSAIKHIEALSTSETLYLSVEYSDNLLGLVICSEDKNHLAVQKALQQIVSFMNINFTADVTVMIGGWVEDILVIHDSFSHCLALLKYKFFMPQNRIFFTEKLDERENSSEIISSAITETFSRGLNSKDLKLIDQAAAMLLTEVQEGLYPADHCHQQLLNIMYPLSIYVKNMRYRPEEYEKNDLFQTLKKINDIVQFKDWLMEFCRDVFNYMEVRSSNKNMEIIEKIKAYIENSLEKDISLDILAEKIHLSAHYTSKLFKDETGVNLIDYITLQRMEKARVLLDTTNLTIKEISFKVGYNNPAYFIKKFREISGDTPLNYKRAKMDSMDSGEK